MANAFILGFDEYQVNQSNQLIIYFRTLFIGPDVPGGSTNDNLQAVIDPTANPSQINTSLADAVRSYAAARGYPVPSSSVIISAVSKA